MGSPWGLTTQRQLYAIYAIKTEKEICCKDLQSSQILADSLIQDKTVMPRTEPLRKKKPNNKT